jgi:excisionase family DNA binding protein
MLEPMKPFDSGFATMRETAQFLRLSTATVQKLVAAGKIPGKRFGRSVRVRWAWLKAQDEDGGRAETSPTTAWPAQ